MQHLLLLHGALGSAGQFINVAGSLKNDFIVHTINFSGHGGLAIPDENFSIPFYANQVIGYLAENNIEQAAIFGYSMGGYVAMYLAKHHPEKITAVITLASKFHWDEAVAHREVKMLDAEAIQLKVPQFAKQLEERHAPADWKLLLAKTAEMLDALGKNNTLQPGDYADITTKCLLLIGDRDKMVTLDETFAVYKKLPKAALGVLPETPHLLEQVNEKLLLFLVSQFLKT